MGLEPFVSAQKQWGACKKIPCAETDLWSERWRERVRDRATDGRGLEGNKFGNCSASHPRRAFLHSAHLFSKLELGNPSHTITIARPALYSTPATMKSHLIFLPHKQPSWGICTPPWRRNGSQTTRMQHALILTLLPHLLLTRALGYNREGKCAVLSVIAATSVARAISVSSWTRCIFRVRNDHHNAHDSNRASNHNG